VKTGFSKPVFNIFRPVTVAESNRLEVGDINVEDTHQNCEWVQIGMNSLVSVCVQLRKLYLRAAILDSKQLNYKIL
jgi:hypothetical protein